MYFALGALVFVSTLALGCLFEKAEHCRCCGSWFKFHQHKMGSAFGVMCRACGHVRDAA